MAFLFKSKKDKSGLPSASRNTASADGSNIPTSAGYASAKESEAQRYNATPSQLGQNAPNAGFPQPTALRARADSDLAAQQHARHQALALQKPTNETSLYPWSQRRLDFVASQANPFPRYGVAVNAVASRDGDIYMMGGLINGTTVKGDLWIVEAGSPNMNCYPVPTKADGPGPRVGHASLLVGNAYIVFGGDTKVDENDVLDDTLYLLNTSTKHWSRALPAGPRPAGRYGHTLNILGSKIYVFGGQVEGYFFNDLVCFDLNALQQSTNRWEILIQNTNDGGPPAGQVPPPRTNHSVVTWNEKLFLFGGTDGLRWFNDVWAYDPRTNSWAPQECIGFIPTAREGHAAAIVGDVMYVFGGRTEDGKDLGDLAAFRLPTRRWYTFQNMGPSPSPRSGHGMTAFGGQIVVFGGEPSSPAQDPPKDAGELCTAYLLDTTKIRYPNDSGQTIPQRIPGRRPSIDRTGTPGSERSSSRDRNNAGSQLRKSSSQDSMNSTSSATGYARPVEGPSTRAVRAPAPAVGPGPPPQQQAPQPQVNGTRQIPPPQGRESPMVGQRADKAVVPGYTTNKVTPAAATQPRDFGQVQQGEPKVYPSPQTPQQGFDYPPSVQSTNGYSTPPTEPARTISQRGHHQQKASVDSVERGVATSQDNAYRSSTEEFAPPVRPSQHPVDSGVGSSPAFGRQNDELMKELEAARSRNAWYASELALAQKSGYRSSTLESPSDDRAADAFGDEEKPLLEALVKMRSELVKVQDSLDKQAGTAAEKIAQIEKERDAAIAEAVYSKTRYAARGWKGTAGAPEESRDIGTPDNERAEEAQRRLAAALTSQNELSAQLRKITTEIEAERKARQYAEDSAEVAQNRAEELDKHKQQSSSELESLRSELHEAQRQAREAAAISSEASTQRRLLQVDKDELSGKLSIAQSDARDHSNILDSLRDAVNASTTKAKLLEQKLEQERGWSADMQNKMAQLKSEHESRVLELETTTRKLRDAEELADSHAAEARTHREAVLAGLGKSSDREVDDISSQDERVSILNQQLESANALVRQHQAAADHASERLRRAEERIAGLENYQEQMSREGLSMRKQLHASSKDVLQLQSENVDLQQQLAASRIDSTSLQVQHSALKDLLHERGIDTSELPKRTSEANLPSIDRIRELEQQHSKAIEEMRASWEQREQDANKAYEDKLAALDSDYQSAVKYLKATEKMLSKMKQEVNRHKSQNKDLEDQLVAERKSSTARGTASSDFENERASLTKELEDMRQRVQDANVQLNQHMQAVRDAHAERDSFRESSLRYQQELTTATQQNRAEADNLKAQNRMLETRADEAERKVQMLLETVGNSVDNYRRQSQIPGTQQHSRGISIVSSGDESNYSHRGSGAPPPAEGSGGEDGAGLPRNSMALDSLASELDTLRMHWESTNKNYNRLSDKSDVEKSPVDGTGGALSDSLATWRQKLDLEERGDDTTGQKQSEVPGGWNA